MDLREVIEKLVEIEKSGVEIRNIMVVCADGHAAPLQFVDLAFVDQLTGPVYDIDFIGGQK